MKKVLIVLGIVGVLGFGNVYATDNHDNAQTASAAVSKIIAIVDLYEQGTIALADGTVVNLSTAQITALKQAFVAQRTIAKNALDAITGN